VKSFWMDLTEVTVSQYRACVNARVCQWLVHSNCASQFSMPGDHPVACVSWAEAKTYCEWVGKRLPTEEEWEYAAHGTDGRLYPWGNSPPSRSLLCWQHSPYTGICLTCSVGSFPAGASPFGLLDMVGNVLEWTSAQGCVSGETHPRCSVTPALKGGPGSCYSYEPTDPDEIAVPPLRSVDTGFRCAR
jgi:formylglycine-generating enzyme required for sulfatase activity